MFFAEIFQSAICYISCPLSVWPITVAIEAGENKSTSVARHDPNIEQQNSREENDEL
jgi:hypothetical protein